VRAEQPAQSASTAPADDDAADAADPASSLAPATAVAIQRDDAQTKGDSSADPAPLLVGAAAQPSVAATPAVVTAAPPPQPSAAPQAFTDQIARPILNLRGGAAGEHVLTITVAPDSLGPVTVRAHLSGGDIRIELSAPTDQGRSALGAILPELKRDLAAGGLNSSLALTTAAGAQADGGQADSGRADSGRFAAGQDAGGQFAATQGGAGGHGSRGDARASGRGDRPATSQTSVRSAAAGRTSLLDVYA